MVKSIGFLLINVYALIIILSVSIIFFSKNRAHQMEDELYKKFLIVNIFVSISGLLLGIAVNPQKGINYIYLTFLNRVYLISLFLWISVMTFYTIYISINNKKKIKKIIKKYYYGILISILLITLLPLSVEISSEGAIATGLAVIYTYLAFAVGFLVQIACLIKNPKKAKNKKYIPLYLLIVGGILELIIQVINPSMNYIVNPVLIFIAFIMYHTIENPDVKMIKQLEVAKEQAVKATRAKSEFLSSMSHEIRTPLNAIMGFSNGLLEEDINDSAKGDVRNIVMASENLLELVNGILDISKIEANKLEIIETPYNFRDMFDELVLLTKARLGDKPLDFKYSYDKNIPEYLYGDATRLKQVIINLLTNAVKYTNSGYMMLNISGKIKEDKVKLVITVQDSGIGIKKENIDKLFSKFDRLGVEKETSVEGTGLGLAITKKLVELMHGNINVQSEYGSGSKFTIRVDQKILEGEELEKAKNKKPVQTEQIIDAHGKKVLVVDDNLLNIKVAERLLAKYNVTIESVMSGQECLDKVNAGKYDLILLDDMMPKMTGGETFVKLKEIEGFNTPVVILTANAITGMREQYLSEGFDDYLAKPIEQLELNRVMKKYLN